MKESIILKLRKNEMIDTGEVKKNYEKMTKQEKADQDVADEVSEKVDSKGDMMHSEKNNW